MARKTNQKTKLLALYQLLLKKGDEDQPISVQTILETLEREGIPAERKSIYTDLEALQDFGVDVQFRRGRNGGWFIGERDFELAELKLLVDAVQSSRFISRKKSEALIKKLSALTSEYQAKQLRRQVYVDRRIKTDNESVYYAIDQLHTAISGRRLVTFRYFDYSPTRERVFRREGAAYLVTPYGLIWSDENYYMVGLERGKTELRHYRVDRMSELKTTQAVEEVPKALREFDIAEYGQRHFHMFSGREGMVRLRCTNRFVNVMLDRFGQDVMLIPDGADHFALTVNAVVSPQFYGWLFGLGDEVKLTAPDWAVAEYRTMLEKALRNEETGENLP